MHKNISIRSYFTKYLYAWEPDVHTVTIYTNKSYTHTCQWKLYETHHRILAYTTFRFHPRHHVAFLRCRRIDHCPFGVDVLERRRRRLCYRCVVGRSVQLLEFHGPGWKCTSKCLQASTSNTKAIQFDSNKRLPLLLIWQPVDLRRREGSLDAHQTHRHRSGNNNNDVVWNKGSDSRAPYSIQPATLSVTQSPRNRHTRRVDPIDGDEWSVSYTREVKVLLNVFQGIFPFIFDLIIGFLIMLRGLN